MLGASTGGVDALCRVVSSFDSNCSPTIIVQHTGQSFGQSLARVLQQKTTAWIRHVSKPNLPIEMRRGVIALVAGNGCQARVFGDDVPQIDVFDAEPVGGHVPSIDVTFESAAKFGERVVGCLMTGMGKDGAQGLHSLRTAGATTFVQNQETSVVYGMPKAAWELGAASAQLPLDQIGPTVLAHAGRIESASKHAGLAAPRRS